MADGVGYSDLPLRVDVGVGSGSGLLYERWEVVVAAVAVVE